ncbi:MAG: argininosuccinate lyase [Eubacterium sp.]|jgi:argininosuccinate lyase|nr:argininosuccinate lyase [Eubacterium sp.]
MWAGRFKKQLDSKINDFNSSLSFDCRMYAEDIEGSKAHVRMLGECGIISKDDSVKIVECLNDIKADIKIGKIEFSGSAAEDIHMFIEEELTARIGDTGKRLHTARSRNDQVALDIRLYLRKEINELKHGLKGIITVLTNLSERHLKTVMPGYTHLQRAQPITFAHHLMAYAQMFLRDIERLSDTYKRMNYCPLGSGALAGSTFPIDREKTSNLLKFNAPTANSIDGVSDRDFCIELSGAISIIMTHLSRFSEEIILWCSWEFKFIDLDDAYATGSSIMPQKKNPDIAELVRGKAARIFGNNMALLAIIKGLPLAYNKDMQEDKEAIFDSIDNAKLCIESFIPMLSTMRVLEGNMRNAAVKGFINATDCADYLVKKGMAFRDAYKITGELVALCISRDFGLEDLAISEYKNFSELFDDDIYHAVNLETCVFKRNSQGGPSPERVLEQIEQTREILKDVL